MSRCSNFWQGTVHLGDVHIHEHKEGKTGTWLGQLPMAHNFKSTFYTIYGREAQHVSFISIHVCKCVSNVVWGWIQNVQCQTKFLKDSSGNTRWALTVFSLCLCLCLCVQRRGGYWRGLVMFRASQWAWLPYSWWFPVSAHSLYTWPWVMTSLQPR